MEANVGCAVTVGLAVNRVLYVGGIGDAHSLMEWLT